MTHLALSAFTKGLLIKCENCQRTATVQEEGLPDGWWMLLDSSMMGTVFCSPDCAYHKLSSLMGEKSFGTLHKEGKFN